MAGIGQRRITMRNDFKVWAPLTFALSARRIISILNKAACSVAALKGHVSKSAQKAHCAWYTGSHPRHPRRLRDPAKWGSLRGPPASMLHTCCGRQCPVRARSEASVALRAWLSEEPVRRLQHAMSCLAQRRELIGQLDGVRQQLAAADFFPAGSPDVELLTEMAVFGDAGCFLDQARRHETDRLLLVPTLRETAGACCWADTQPHGVAVHVEARWLLPRPRIPASQTAYYCLLPESWSFAAGLQLSIPGV